MISRKEWFSRIGWMNWCYGMERERGKKKWQDRNEKKRIFIFLFSQTKISDDELFLFSLIPPRNYSFFLHPIFCRPFIFFPSAWDINCSASWYDSIPRQRIEGKRVRRNNKIPDKRIERENGWEWSEGVKERNGEWWRNEIKNRRKNVGGQGRWT